ncbi:hypothetical protein NDU88_011092 [Pleurodeles waltl]|uniref:Uncharacterized protein n=1 Tax=Pleurodeles waltl TaxID=8319 RepID=A0AAV7S2Y3_PLEWA|nr:hypothetical protein NDU88_011092 [Pleurodeles waltl]
MVRVCTLPFSWVSCNYAPSSSRQRVVASASKGDPFFRQLSQATFLAVSKSHHDPSSHSGRSSSNPRHSVTRGGRRAPKGSPARLAHRPTTAPVSAQSVRFRCGPSRRPATPLKHVSSGPQCRAKASHESEVHAAGSSAPLRVCPLRAVPLLNLCCYQHLGSAEQDIIAGP